jgi:hypothetical protein
LISHYFCIFTQIVHEKVTQPIKLTCCTTKLASNNTKYSYLSKRTQWEILQKLINLLLNMHIHSYAICSYVYTSHTQLKISIFFFFFFFFFFFYFKKMPLRNLFQVKDGSKGHWRVTMNCELNE